MAKIRLICTFTLLVILALIGVACSKSSESSRDESLRVAEEFIKNEATYRFDGIPETLQLTNTTSVVDGWRFVIKFDTKHAGYGDRTGQIRSEAITHHLAEITVLKGSITAALMDQIWDMKNQKTVDDIEIKVAKIHEVTIDILKSNPPQIGVNIKMGLPDGCTVFFDAVAIKEGNTVNIEMTTKRPKDAVCTAIYTYFDETLNLGSDFEDDVTYTLKVNDYTTTFSLMGQPIDDYKIKPAPIHEVEVYFMESFPVQVGVHFKGGLSDGCTTFHEAVVNRQGNTINIEVTVKRPKDRQCPAIYTYFDESMNLSNDFTTDETYTLKVNDFTTTFKMP